MCYDKRVIGGLVLAGVGIYALAPEMLAAALPLLILAVCPLSMILMMKMMMPGGAGAQSGAGGDEVAELRAEIDKLRGDRPERAEFGPPAGHPG